MDDSQDWMGSLFMGSCLLACCLESQLPNDAKVARYVRRGSKLVRVATPMAAAVAARPITPAAAFTRTPARTPSAAGRALAAARLIARAKQGRRAAATPPVVADRGLLRRRQQAPGPCLVFCRSEQ